MDKDLFLLKSKSGLVRIRRIDGSNEIVLDTDHQYGQQPTKVLDLLSFLLNKGLRTEKRLTVAGYYSPDAPSNPHLLHCDSSKIAELDFYFDRLNRLHLSLDRSEYIRGSRLSNMLQIHNNALMMASVGFLDESYLNFVRILDLACLPEKSNRWIFPDRVIRMLPIGFLENIHSKFQDKELYQTNHIKIGLELFQGLKSKAAKQNGIDLILYKDNYIPQFFFIALQSVYDYRSKFVHAGFPFPYKVKYIFTAQDMEWLNYFGPSVGESKSVQHEPYRMRDIHDQLDLDLDRHLVRDFKKLYFLLPTWFLLKLIAREVIQQHLQKLKYDR